MLPLVAPPLVTVPLLMTPTVPLIAPAPLLAPALFDPVLVTALLPLLEAVPAAPLPMAPLLPPSRLALSRPPHAAMRSSTNVVGDLI
jgi:hypothetical protein